jgi:hypothetical protein
MTPTQKANRDLGTDSEFAALIERVEGFDFTAPTHTDKLNLTRALKVLAKDIVERHRNIAALEAQLIEKVSLAEVTSEIGTILNVLSPARPKRKRWF